MAVPIGVDGTQNALLNGDDMPLGVIEGNARQAMADRLLRNNPYIRKAGSFRASFKGPVSAVGRYRQCQVKGPKLLMAGEP